MRVTVSPSDNYSAEEVEALLKTLEAESVPVVQGGMYHRRSLEELPPVVIVVASFVVGALGTGFLNAMGADAWAALKRIVSRVASTEHRGQHPTILLELEFNDCHVDLRPLAGVEVIPTRLDAALDRVEEIGGSVGLWFVPEANEWLTLDELMARRSGKAQRSADQPE